MRRSGSPFPGNQSWPVLHLLSVRKLLIRLPVAHGNCCFHSSCGHPLAGPIHIAQPHQHLLFLPPDGWQDRGSYSGSKQSYPCPETSSGCWFLLLIWEKQNNHGLFHGAGRLGHNFSISDQKYPPYYVIVIGLWIDGYIRQVIKGGPDETAQR